MVRKKSKSVDDTPDFGSEVAVFTQVDPASKAPKAPKAPKEPDEALAAQLGGHPKLFAKTDLEGLLVLQARGIAADFGEDGWARGHLWRAFVRKG